MAHFQAEKSLIRAYYQALDSAKVKDIESVLQEYTAPAYIWRSYAPFYLQTDIAQVARLFWQPFRTAFCNIERRMDVFFAGKNHMDGGKTTWVCSMGHLMGLFDAPWLGLLPTGKMTLLRYCEFHCVADGQITQTAFYFDIPHLMMQAGYRPFAGQAGAHLVQPGPADHAGLLFEDAPPQEGQNTLQAINNMINLGGQWQSGLPLEEELAINWHDDMKWWGPAGIGATYTIPRYAKQHSGPFRAAFSDRSKTNHVARIAEGTLGGFFGWPNFTAKPTGGYLGYPPSDTLCEFRVIDIYRREGDKLKENWIFIDMLYYFEQLGIDILAQAIKAGPHE